MLISLSFYLMGLWGPWYLLPQQPEYFPLAFVGASHQFCPWLSRDLDLHLIYWPASWFMKINNWNFNYLYMTLALIYWPISLFLKVHHFVSNYSNNFACRLLLWFCLTLTYWPSFCFNHLPLDARVRWHDFAPFQASDPEPFTM